MYPFIMLRLNCSYKELSKRSSLLSSVKTETIQELSENQPEASDPHPLPPVPKTPNTATAYEAIEDPNDSGIEWSSATGGPCLVAHTHSAATTVERAESTSSDVFDAADVTAMTTSATTSSGGWKSPTPKTDISKSSHKHNVR